MDFYRAVGDFRGGFVFVEPDGGFLEGEPLLGGGFFAILDVGAA